jgi:putative heme iron utilization protein
LQSAEHTRQAHDLLQTQIAGTLATTSAEDPLQPKASYAPYLVFDDTIVFYLNDHTDRSKHLVSNAQTSLLIMGEQVHNDPYNRAHLTIEGTVKRYDRDSSRHEELAKAFFGKFPAAASYHNVAPNHEFAFYVLFPERMNLFAGFAQAGDLDIDEFWLLSRQA